MWLILIIVIGIIVYFIFAKGGRSSYFGSPPRESPVDILKRRYANGEITKEEFERLKKDIES